MPYVDATAPTVIDEALCRSCIQLVQPKELILSGVESEADKQAAANKKATLAFREVECLMLSFKSARARSARRQQPPTDAVRTHCQPRS